MKYLMEQIQLTYNDLRDDNEVAIVERYSTCAKYYTIGLATFLLGIIILVVVQLWPNFIYVILSANISRSRHLFISTEYFIDQERYFNLPLFHTNAAIIIESTVLVATGTIMITYFQHACGMFTIASYRIEKVIQICEPKSTNRKNEVLVYKCIIHAVNIHRRAMFISNYLISRLEITFMLLIAFGVLALSLNLFRVFQIILLGYKTEILINLYIIFTCCTYMFLSNFVGQQIIDHNNHVFVTTYKVQWYITPLSVQKLILLLLQRGNKSFVLRVGIFATSLEGFAKLLNAALSYFIVMYSTQK